MRRLHWMLVLGLLMVLLTACAKPASPTTLEVPEDGVAHVVYFYAEDCPRCGEVRREVLDPIQAQCGASLELKAVDIGVTEGYQAFVATEQALIGDAGRWDIPTVVVGEKYFIGEDAIRTDLVPHLQCVFGDGGNDWPDVPELTALAVSEPAAQGDPFSGAEEGDESCVEDEAEVCASPNPIFVLYYSKPDCPTACERTYYDLRYLQGVFPQMSFEERNVKEDAAMAAALAEHYGLSDDERGVAPAVFVGEDALVGDEVTLEALRTMLEQYAETGAMAVWYTLDVESK